MNKIALILALVAMPCVAQAEELPASQKPADDCKAIAAKPAEVRNDFVTADPEEIICGKSAWVPADDRPDYPSQKQLDAAAVGGLHNAAPDFGHDAAKKIEQGRKAKQAH